MRKILISVLLVLLIILAYFTIFQGISIGTFEILSTEGIVDLNDNLTTQIEVANAKIKNDLQMKQTALSESVGTLLENKQAYYDLANVSTESEIDEANTQELYNIEYLWLRIGRHARTEGVNIKMDVMEGYDTDATMKNLSFTVTGQYVGIIDFVSAIEEDSELGFRIENFNLLPSGSDLQATFTVTGVRIKLENTTQSVGTTTGDTTGDTAGNTTGNTMTDTTATEGTNTTDMTTQEATNNEGTTTDTNTVSQ